MSTKKELLDEFIQKLATLPANDEGEETDMFFAYAHPKEGTTYDVRSRCCNAR